MNAETTENLRIGILRVFDANRTRRGLGIVGMGHMLRVYGINAATFAGDDTAFYNAIADALQYLCDKGMAEEVDKTINRENRCWRATDKGIGYLDEQG